MQGIYVSRKMKLIARRLRAHCVYETILRALDSTRRHLKRESRKLARQFLGCRRLLKYMLRSGSLDTAPCDRILSFLFDQALRGGDQCSSAHLELQSTEESLLGARYLREGRTLIDDNVALGAVGPTDFMAHHLVAYTANTLLAASAPDPAAELRDSVSVFDFHFRRALHRVLAKQCLATYTASKKDPVRDLLVQFDCATADLMSVVHPYLFSSSERARSMLHPPPQPRSVSDILSDIADATTGRVSVSVEDTDENADSIVVYGIDLGEDCKQPLTCAITQQPMVFPVVVGTGHVFEATSIRYWLRRNKFCPISRQSIETVLFSKSIFELTESLLRHQRSMDGRAGSRGGGFVDIGYLPCYISTHVSNPVAPVTVPEQALHLDLPPRPSEAWLHRMGVFDADHYVMP